MELSAERKFYSRMAIFLAAVVFLGFAPSFYLRGVVPAYPRPNPSLPGWLVIHGAIFTAWMIAVVAQTRLVAAGRRDLHMKLGAATMVLAAAMIPLMYLVSVWQVGRANQPPFTDPLTWTIVPLAAIIPFAILLAAGWQNRLQPQWHKRIMLSAAIVIVMGPAVGRLPIAPPTIGGFTFVMLVGLALFGPLFIWDRRSIGKVHSATWFGFGLGAISILIPLAVFWLGLDWAAIAAHLPGI